ncbi:MAG: hypothetical protein K2X08_02010 [Chlamydiales bacterium]|nr:hypothetical protein [Chlamydiales bacterium]
MAAIGSAVLNPKQFDFGKVYGFTKDEGNGKVSVTYNSSSVDTLSQKVNKFINQSTNNLYNIWRLTTDSLSLANELYPREALGKTIQWLKAGSAPFILTYQVHTINEVMSLRESGVTEKALKAWLDFVDASLLSWGTLSSALDLPKRWAFGSEKTILGFGAAVIDAKMQAENLFDKRTSLSKSVTPLDKQAAESEVNIAFLRTCAAIISLAAAAIGVATLIVSGSAIGSVVSVVPLSITLAMAVAITSLKLSAAFYEQVREYQSSPAA